AEGRARAGDRPQSARPHRGAADARSRRRRDRVRPPPPRRGARRRTSGSARLARARRDPLALGPHPRHLRGSVRGRVPAGRQRRGARHRHDGREKGRGCGLSDRDLPPDPELGTEPEMLDEAPRAPEPVEASPTAYAPSVAERLGILQRAGGVVVPVITAIFAFLMGGIVVAATGHNPVKVYKGIISGTGLPWFFHFGHYHIDIPFTSHHVFFWWNTSVQSNDAYNLQQTLILATTLTLTGLAVAFAFRCGLFNIGGQGQYWIGVITGIWVGTSFKSMGHVPHVLLTVVVASLAAGAWAAIAGFLKATTGAHEVISTIMLNWIAYWLGFWAFGQGGPLQNSFNPS